MTEQNRYIVPGEASEMTGLSTSWLRELRRQGKLRGTRPVEGRQRMWLYLREDIEKLKRVRQVERRDCGIASVAMFLEKTYQDVVLWFPKDASKTGLYLADLKRVLEDRQYKIGRWVLRDGNPLPAVKSILETTVVPGGLGGHFVLAMPDGMVFDPAQSRPKTYNVSQYEVIRAIYFSADLERLVHT